MSPLKARLIKQVEASGPISIGAYMNLCLHDRRHGYYATRPGLGRDFITAPEISQVFGELIGLWAAHEWQEMGAPTEITLVEIGPGRGTLMADALRAVRRVPGFLEAVHLCFIEPSPVLRAALNEQFGAFQPVFVDGMEAVPADKPLLLLANEWLDCLPARQFLRLGESWQERVVGVNEAGELTFGLAAEAFPDGLALPVEAETLEEAGEVLEVQPGLGTLVEALKDVFGKTRGRALFIDYGPDEGMPGDTLRAYSEGEQVDPLAGPGTTDLTVDVDFTRLARLASAAGLQVAGPLPQGQFLLSLGAEARLNQLAKAKPDEAEALYEGVRRLVDPAEMGARFKALVISHPDLPPPAGF